jgi:Tol biopolymer transport system component
MKRLVIPCVFLLALATGIRAQSGYDLLQQAVSKEQVEGKVKEAIALYQRIIKEFAADRALTARALVQLGGAYEKLGSAEARAVYARVISEFADQPQVFAEARTRMAALEIPPPNAATRRATRRPLSTVQVWGGTNVGLMGSITGDGRYLSFADRQENGGADLAIRDLVTGEQRRLTNKDAGSNTPSREFSEFSAMSRDGSQVAYAWYGKDQWYELRVVETRGGQPRMLYRNRDVEWVQPHAWSPDGKLVAAVFARVDRTNQIVLVTVADGSVRVLKTTDWRTPDTIAFSPDGRYLAYDFPPDETSSQRDLYVMAVDGSRETAVVTHAAHDTLLGWFRSGDRLLFGSDRGGSMGAWALLVKDGIAVGAPELIKADVGRILPLGFSDAGDFYYYARMGMLDVFTAAIDPASGKALDTAKPLSHRSPGEKLQAMWSPDGQRLLYSMHSTERVGGNPRLLGILNLKTGSEQILPPPLEYVQWPMWSDDGDSIIVQGPDFKGRGGLHRIDIASGTMSRITDEGRLQPASGRDGKSILFFEQPNATGRSLEIAARDLTAAQQRIVYAPPGGGRFSVSPDGQTLAIKLQARSLPDGGSVLAEIRLVAIGSGEARTLLTVTDDLFSGGAIAWSADGRFIFFTKGLDPSTEVWRVPVAGGSAQRTGIALPRIQRISVHPDGKTLAISAGVPKFEVWALENVPGAAAKPVMRSGIRR